MYVHTVLNFTANAWCKHKLKWRWNRAIASARFWITFHVELPWTEVRREYQYVASWGTQNGPVRTQETTQLPKAHRQHTHKLRMDKRTHKSDRTKIEIKPRRYPSSQCVCTKLMMIKKKARWNGLPQCCSCSTEIATRQQWASCRKRLFHHMTAKTCRAAKRTLGGG